MFRTALRSRCMHWRRANWSGLGTKSTLKTTRHVSSIALPGLGDGSAWPWVVAAGAALMWGSRLTNEDRSDTSQQFPVDPLQQLAARCPKLDGHALPPPALHKSQQNWKVGQAFSMKEDDPFRMKVAVQPPSFLQGDPASRHAHILKTEMPVKGLELEKAMSPYQGEMIKSKTFAWVFDDVLTEEQCLAVIQSSNSKGFVPALQGTSFLTKDKAGGDMLVYNTEFRDVYSCMYDSPELSSWLFRALEPHLKTLPVPDGWRVDHLNSFVRTLCYCHAGQRHRPHFDAMMKYPKGKYPEDHKNATARSFMTFFLYLSNVPSESGGGTAFPRWQSKDIDAHGNLKQEESDEDMHCNPAPGRVLIFSQNMYHSGAPLKDHIKYVIRSDVMCVPVDS